VLYRVRVVLLKFILALPLRNKAYFLGISGTSGNFQTLIRFSTLNIALPDSVI
jgi:hypothetical protein